MATSWGDIASVVGASVTVVAFVSTFERRHLRNWKYIWQFSFGVAATFGGCLLTGSGVLLLLDSTHALVPRAWGLVLMLTGALAVYRLIVAMWSGRWFASSDVGTKK